MSGSTIGGFALSILAAGFLSSQSNASENLVIEKDLYSVSPMMQSFDKGPEFPIFPQISAGNPLIEVDYFYAKSCARCALSSKAVFALLADEMPIKVTFHPVSITEDDFKDGVIESIMYSTSPTLFRGYHIGSFLEKESNPDHDFIGFAFGLAELANKSAELEYKMEFPDKWRQAVDVNSDLVQQMKVQELPAFLIGGSAKYEGFESKQILKDAILREIGSTQ